MKHERAVSQPAHVHSRISSDLEKSLFKYNLADGLSLSLLSEGEEEDGPTVESGEGEAEADSYWKKKEAFLRGSTVSLGEKFSSGRFKNAFLRIVTCNAFLKRLAPNISISQPLSVHVQKCL